MNSSANGFFPALAGYLAQIRSELLAPYHLDDLILFVLIGGVISGLVNWFWKQKA